MPRLAAIADRALRIAATAAHACLRAYWFFRPPRTFGTHAIALTPEGKIILVKLRYARGWRVPGGGRSEHEDPLDAALRELREEIGMTSHGEVRAAQDFSGDTESLVVVRDVRYRPSRWNWEVEQILETDPNSLPSDVVPLSARWIETLRPFF